MTMLIVENSKKTKAITFRNVLTKPAKLAKQQMSKRCQDLASFIETLMEEQPKADAEFRVEINDQDKRYFERDSMLGGISPRHDCYDSNASKSSTETRPSYNQLNYNDTLQRYFESRQPLSFEDYNNLSEEYKLSLKNPKLHYSSPEEEFVNTKSRSCNPPAVSGSGSVDDEKPYDILGTIRTELEQLFRHELPNLLAKVTDSVSKALESKFLELEKNVRTVSNLYDGIKSTVEKSTSYVKKLQTENKNLNDQIKMLQTKLSNMEEASLRQNNGQDFKISRYWVFQRLKTSPCQTIK
ncbi:unnamed protein product [Diatraea saccharalis]|uniref:Period circadian protein n=1 Tax=Diatraea saccharalis TaxID=40085 RepID=A0A9N9R641_9NEOP|nr:unnamed protein product [Diatraea saccharalis]